MAGFFMDLRILTDNPLEQTSDCLVVGIYAGGNLTPMAEAIDSASKGQIRELLNLGDMTGKTDQKHMMYHLDGVSSPRVLLVGLGAQEKLSLKNLCQSVTNAFKLLNNNNIRSVINSLSDLRIAKTSQASVVKETTQALCNQPYAFTQCKSGNPSSSNSISDVSVLVSDPSLESAMLQGQAIALGMSLTKDLSNLPGNICTPSYLAQQALELEQTSDKLSVDILEESDMQELGMGSFLSVSLGSREPAKLIVMKYSGASDDQQPVVYVGKGLTFDAGGISIKSAAGMDEMKYDMCGGASVFGVMKACIELDLNINFIGIVPSSENLPDGAANKPGDIVTSMAGTTIEILNTDAEGRLILCDALTYAERFNPAAVIDIATLTGACIVALGHHTSGLLSTDDQLADEILEASNQAQDKAWRLPIADEYQTQLKSNFADIANIGGRAAGTITAACFLSRFTENYSWAHLDIAGTAWVSGANKGATGRPVPLLTEILIRRCS